MAEANLKDLTSAVYKIAENSPKIQKDVKDIRDAVIGTGGILEAINVIVEKLYLSNKKGRIEKLASKPTLRQDKTLIKNTNSMTDILNKILIQMSIMNSKLRLKTENIRTGRMSRLNADNFRREPDRKDRGKGLESFYKSIDVIDKLKGIKLKDFLFAKTKLKHLGNILKRSLKIFSNFKNKEEAENTICFIESSVGVVESLKKVGKTARLSKKGAGTLETIYFGKRGKGGLINLFRNIYKNKKEIEGSKKSIADIHKATGTMLLTSLALTGIAVVGIPAMLGALLLKGIVYLLTGTFFTLSKVSRPVKKGSRVLLAMSVSIIAFSLGLGLMTKAIKDMKLKDVGLMMASIAGIGLTVAGIGLLAAPIALGSASLLLLSTSLGLFALTLHFWGKFDAKKPIANIKEAIGGLREVFGLEFGKGNEKKSFGQRLKGGLMDIAMGVLNMGSSFFIMGSLLLTGVALGVLYHGLKNWDNFNGTKAAKNIKVAIGALKDVFGIGDTGKGFTGKLMKLGGGILDMGVTLLQGGKTLAEMGIISIATGLSDTIRLFLIPWNKYDSTGATSNLRKAITSLKEIFGLENKNDKLGGKIISLSGGLLDMGSTLLQAGSELAKMGTITIATGMSDMIRLFLIPWEKYNAIPAATNMGIAINSLKHIFGLEARNDTLMDKLGRLGGNILDMGSTLLNAGGVFVKMGTITIATGMAGKIKENLAVWEDYDSSKPIKNMGIAVNGLLNLFGINQLRNENQQAEKKKGLLESVGSFMKGVKEAAARTADTVDTLGDRKNALVKIKSLDLITSILSSVKKSLAPWDTYDPTNALKSIKKSISDLSLQITNVRSLDSDRSLFNYFEKSARHIDNGLDSLSTGLNRIGKSNNIPFKSTVDIINSLDITKASVLIDIFKTFSAIKNNKQFDRFSKAVDTFSKSCSDLIDSLDNFSKSSSTFETGEEPTTETTNVNGGVSITNSQDIANAIAAAIKSLPINVQTDISDVRLVINNETGKRVILTLDN